MQIIYKPIITLSICMILFAGSRSPAQSDFDHTHSKWTKLLRAHVNDRGQVNYKALIRNRSPFDEYIKVLGSVSSTEIDSWSRDNQLAYWINAYNAFAIKIILDHYPIKPGKGLKAKFYPVKSIQQIPGVWDDIKNTAGGRHVALNYIEHEIIRKKFREPRIHFAIVCVSVGCPYIWNQAYQGENFKEQLSASAKRFCKNRVNVKLDLPNNAIYLSKIFKWFHEDFAEFKGANNYGKYNGVISFFLPYLSKPLQRHIKSEDIDIKWFDYDWSLNEQ